MFFDVNILSTSIDPEFSKSLFYLLWILAYREIFSVSLVKEIEQ